MKKTWTFVVYLFCVSASFTAQSSDTVKIGALGTYKPWNFKYGEQLVGFDIDVAKAVCEIEKLKCTFDDQAWDALISSLRFGKYDVLASGLYRTSAREQFMMLSDNYVVPHSELFTTSASPLVSLCEKDCEKTINLNNSDAKTTQTLKVLSNGLKGKKIAALKGSAQFLFVKGCFPESKIIPVNSTEDVEKKVLSGLADVGISGTERVTSLSEKEDVKAIPVELNGGKLGDGVAFIFSKKTGQQLVVQFNDGIDKLKRNGKLKALSIQWFGIDITK